MLQSAGGGASGARSAATEDSRAAARGERLDLGVASQLGEDHVNIRGLGGAPGPVRRATAGRPVKVLYLLRHAKSSWDDPVLADHERPLSPRGQRAAARIAEHLDGEGIRPALVLCSSSRRTRQTLELVAAALPDVPTQVEADLYGAGEGSLLLRLQQLPDTAAPCCSSATTRASRTWPSRWPEAATPSLARLRAKMPTGALATLAAPVTRWRDLRPRGAELVAFVVPRGLS